MNTLKTATDLEVHAKQLPADRQEPLETLTWLVTEEAARYLRMTANALRIMVYRGYIRPRKLRRRLYFRRIELDRLLESSLF